MPQSEMLSHWTEADSLSHDVEEAIRNKLCVNKIHTSVVFNGRDFKVNLLLRRDPAYCD